MKGQKVKRRHLFEFEDSPRFPDHWRELVTDYLSFMVSVFHLYRPAVDKLAELLKKTRSGQIVDVGSGSSGPWRSFIRELKENHDLQISVTLTDKFPNQKSFRSLKKKTGDRIQFIEFPVDGRRLPESLQGTRTFFNIFHHFIPADARTILRQAIHDGAGIGIFELTGRNLFTMFLILLSPLWVWLFTPFIKPFTRNRFVLTYLIPVVPFVVLWDGMVSNLRTYSPQELKQLVTESGNSKFEWEIGRKRNVAGPNITYLIGYPGD